MALAKRVKRVFKRLKGINNNFNLEYLNSLELPIDDKLVLVEGGQGSNINGNMFSMLREIKTNPRFSEYKVVFVVTENTINDAKKRMQKYGFNDVILSIRSAKDYCKYLATAKYIMTDNSFPPYFNKRDEQVFLNTWHGTPLKTLGMSDKSNLASLANIQKNYLMSDYALFPNDFTKNVFMEDYDLKNIFTGYSLIANYPRNYVFYDAEQGVQMKKALGIDDKQVFAYMPTWRGTGRKADTEAQLKETMKILKQFDKALNDNQLLLVNLHFLLASEINCDGFKHIQAFSSDYDTYEVLNACDGLITDYSSVFFDFAVTRKKVILFAYDKEKYLGSRGVYIPFESLPFPIVETVGDVVKEMSKPAKVDEAFLDEYCSNGWKNSCERLFDLMITGKSDGFELKKQENANKDICLIYAGTMPATHFENIKAYIEANKDYNHVIVYRRNFNKANREFVLSLDDEITTLGTLTAFQYSLKEFIKLNKAKLFKSSANAKALKEFYSREAQRMFYHIKPSKIVDFSCNNLAIAGMMASYDCDKEYIIHGDYFTITDKHRKNESFIKDFEAENGFEAIDMSEEENKIYLSNKEDEYAHPSFRKISQMNNILPLYLRRKNALKCVSLFSLKTPIETRLNDTSIFVGDKEYKARFIANKNKLSKKHFGIYSFKAPIEDLIDMPSSNKVTLCYENKYGHKVHCHIVYFSMIYRFFLGLRSSILKDKNTDTVAVFRQSRGNRLNIYVRSWIKSDDFSARIKQDIAFVLSYFWHGKKANSLVMLYEKNSSKYEESASVTFEKLIDSGYKYAYFIIDKDYEYIDRIPEKYLPNIVYKHSFKHYLYFFRAKTFIGTEQPVHAIDLKTFNIVALKKIADKNINYVFLQHGVMYMVSLDSESRHMFKRKSLNGKYRVVVSSQLEADHFTELGRHYPEDLYICGLPKFDKNKLSPNADKIVIMPTWRPWEINMARSDFSQTDYFKMVMRIYDSVPEELKEKVIILPHPLIVNELRELAPEIAERVVVDARYDDILMESRILITDYSSIAYDAFYRGTRVIFYWEEKDFCMSQYGPTTKLMLNEENVYGDYFYSTDGLSEAILNNYNNPQTEDYKNKYSKIVQFHDGKNTDRLIEFLKEDEIINL